MGLEILSKSNINAGEIATGVARESLSKFSQIPFADWVRHALGLAPGSVKTFERRCEGLSFQLYYYLRQHLDESVKYHEVVEVSVKATCRVHANISEASEN